MHQRSGTGLACSHAPAPAWVTPKQTVCVHPSHASALQGDIFLCKAVGETLAYWRSSGLSLDDLEAALMAAEARVDAALAQKGDCCGADDVCRDQRPTQDRRWSPTIGDAISPDAKPISSQGLGIGGVDLFSAAHLMAHLRTAVAMMEQLEESKSWRQVATGGLQLWSTRDKQRDIQRCRANFIVEEPMLVRTFGGGGVWFAGGIQHPQSSRLYPTSETVCHILCCSNPSFPSPHFPSLCPQQNIMCMAREVDLNSTWNPTTSEAKVRGARLKGGVMEWPGFQLSVSPQTGVTLEQDVKPFFSPASPLADPCAVRPGGVYVQVLHLGAMALQVRIPGSMRMGMPMGAFVVFATCMCQKAKELTLGHSSCTI